MVQKTSDNLLGLSGLAGGEAVVVVVVVLVEYSKAAFSALFV